MPYALKLDNQDEVDKYLDSIYNTIIIKDIATRTKGSKIRATFNKIKDFVYTKDKRGDREDNVRT